MHTAESLLRGAECQVESTPVLELAGASWCTAYDHEFVALAGELGVSPVTTDRQIIKEFPDTAVSPRSFDA